MINSTLDEAVDVQRPSEADLLGGEPNLEGGQLGGRVPNTTEGRRQGSISTQAPLYG